jgi:Kdo2-lipid IVA lauroyltransferase/acyltransferase
MLKYIFYFPFFICPRFLKQGLSKGITYFWFYIWPVRYKLMLRQIKNSYPDKSQSWYDEKLFISFYNLMLTIFEYSYFVFSPKKVLKYCELKNTHFLDEELKNNKGLYIMAFHVGNGEIALFRTAMAGYKLNLIAKYISSPLIHKLIFETRELCGLKHIAPKNSLDKILEAMNNNESIVFVQDQFTYPPRGIASTFLHQSAFTNSSIATFVQKRNRRIVPANVYREGPQDKVIVEFQEPIVYEETDDTTSFVQKCNDWMTKQVDRRPDMWMWIHDRFKRQPK